MTTLKYECNLPDLSGKTYVITGANTGLGFAASKIVAGKKARVIMVGRSQEKLDAAAAAIRKDVEGAQVEVMICDLSDLDSISAFAKSLAAKETSITGLLNNAGVMMSPEQPRTKQGFEMQLGTNHYGHFALTLQVLPLLKAYPGEARIVNVSSKAAERGQMRWDDLNFNKKGSFSSMKAYGQSKLANLLFSMSLRKRLSGTNVSVLSAHPGVSLTDLPRHLSLIPTILLTPLAYLIASTPEGGTLSEVVALVSPDAKDGDYWGPDTYMQWKGKPGRVAVPPHALNEEDAEKLWKISEEATGVSWV